MMRIEIRGNQVLLDGYVNAVDRESRVLYSEIDGKFVEKVAPKTFERALSKSEDVKLLFNHNKDRKLGSLAEGNLQLYEDSIGLRAIATVIDEEVIQKARNKELKGWSFGFRDNKKILETHHDDIQIRTLKDIDLLEVSILDITPAYIATSVEVRNQDQNEEMELRNLEFIAEIENIEEKREEIKVFDYSLFEKQIQILKLKGSN